VTLTCPTCYQHNAAYARYCERCGNALPAHTPNVRSNPWANAALVTTAALSLMTAFFAVNPYGSMWSNSRGALVERYRDPSSLVIRSRDYYLGADKAQAVFDLLSPADVDVVVRKRRDGLSVEGADWELAALDRFVELMQRKQGQDRASVREHIDRILRASSSVEKYRLSRNKREALHQILAFDDVPVLVTDGWRNVQVQATEEDQETIRAVVEILGGRPDRCNGVGCFFGLHSSRCRLKPLDQRPPP